MVRYKDKYFYMRLRIGLKQTNSFVRLWEILILYITLQFQDKNYFLNLWKLTHEWCVQRNRSLSKNRFKIEISIKISGNSVKLNVRKKKQWALEKYYSFAVVGLGKNSGALRWLIRQNLRLSKKCDWWKAIFFGPEGTMIGKGELKGVSRSYLPTRTPSE